MADWDAEDFEPDTAAASVITMPSDKWDGEDEEDDIKVGFQHFVLSSLNIHPLIRMPGMPSRTTKTSPRSPRRPSR